MFVWVSLKIGICCSFVSKSVFLKVNSLEHYKDEVALYR